MITFGRAAIRFVMDLTKSMIHPSSTTKTQTPRGKTRDGHFCIYNFGAGYRWQQFVGHNNE